MRSHAQINYAALVTLAQDAGELDLVVEFMLAIRQFIRTRTNFRLLLTTSRLSVNQKIDTIRSILPHMTPVSELWIRTILATGRLKQLSIELTRLWRSLKQRSISAWQVTTANPLTPTDQDYIRRTIDPMGVFAFQSTRSVIGGIRITKQLGKTVDMTYQHQIEYIKSTILETRP